MSAPQHFTAPVESRAQTVIPSELNWVTPVSPDISVAEIALFVELVPIPSVPKRLEDTVIV